MADQEFEQDVVRVLAVNLQCGTLWAMPARIDLVLTQLHLPACLPVHPGGDHPPRTPGWATRPTGSVSGEEVPG